MKSNYYNKYKNIIPKHFFEKENIKILEFGVEPTNHIIILPCEQTKDQFFLLTVKIIQNYLKVQIDIYKFKR